MFADNLMGAMSVTARRSAGIAYGFRILSSYDRVIFQITHNSIMSRFQYNRRRFRSNSGHSRRLPTHGKLVRLIRGRELEQDT
jgi:hypothetical protein